ncbi:MAG: hypothetical protein OXC46_04720 [Thaumarchaeota archaeon]|nr:hypothetical protein [Nitrososphaerota archaeon]
MECKLFKIICKKGHKANAVIWENHTIEQYVRDRKCNSCCSEVSQR